MEKLNKRTWSMEQSMESYFMCHCGACPCSCGLCPCPTEFSFRVAQTIPTSAPYISVSTAAFTNLNNENQAHFDMNGGVCIF